MTADGSKQKIIGIALISLAVFVLLGYIVFDFINNTPEFSKNSIAMGTVVSQMLKGTGAEATADEIIEKINEVEKSSLSWRIKGSDIFNINANPGKPAIVSKNTIEWVDKTLKVCKSSDGALDITVGKLTALWDIGGVNPRLPKQAEIDSVLGGVGFEKVAANSAGIKIANGQSLDMGALGKGIACDEALEILQASKVKSAIISVGGSILLFGQSKKINVGIRNPRGEANDYMGILSLKDCCISTSGDYEKVLTVNGKKYHHILNPKTGYPAESGLMSVTIVCDSGLLSDALSTACFVMGYEKSLPLLKEFDAEAVFITHDNYVFVTNGLKDKFQLSESTLFKLEAGNN